MLCLRCGKSLPEGQKKLLCSDCAPPAEPPAGEGQPDVAGPDEPGARSEAAGEPRGDDADFGQEAAAEVYAGFWLRLFAMLFDGCVMQLIGLGVTYLMSTLVSQLLFSRSTEFGTGLAMMLAVLAGTMGVYVIIWFCYYFLLEASPLHATLGKLLFGLKVADAGGAPLSVMQAIGRNLAKLLSGLTLLVGFAAAAFTRRKQGLHDIISGTVVIRTAPRGKGILAALVLGTLFFSWGLNGAADSKKIRPHAAHRPAGAAAHLSLPIISKPTPVSPPPIATLSVNGYQAKAVEALAIYSPQSEAGPTLTVLLFADKVAAERSLGLAIAVQTREELENVSGSRLIGRLHLFLRPGSDYCSPFSLGSAEVYFEQGISPELTKPVGLSFMPDVKNSINVSCKTGDRTSISVFTTGESPGVTRETGSINFSWRIAANAKIWVRQKP